MYCSSGLCAVLGGVAATEASKMIPKPAQLEKRTNDETLARMALRRETDLIIAEI